MNALEILAFWTPSPAELVVIMIVALLLFGKRLPEVARSLGRGLAEFRRASTDLRREFVDAAEEARIEPPKAPQEAPAPPAAPDTPGDRPGDG